MVDLVAVLRIACLSGTVSSVSRRVCGVLYVFWSEALERSGLPHHRLSIEACKMQTGTAQVICLPANGWPDDMCFSGW